MKQDLLRRYEEAIRNNPKIASFKSELKTHQGTSLEDIEKLGLNKKDLLRLSRLGLAVKAYTRNFFDPPADNEAAWYEADITYKDAFIDSRGYVKYEKRVEKEKRPKYRHTGSGMRARWILIVPNFGAGEFGNEA
jgi:hypothetical protein